jgi:hypothetical protein
MKRIRCHAVETVQVLDAEEGVAPDLQGVGLVKFGFIIIRTYVLVKEEI